MSVANTRLIEQIGLAAGIIKDVDDVNKLDLSEFGYAVIGTFTNRPRDGNKEPNIIYNEDKTIINSLGYPNNGIEDAVLKLINMDAGIKLVGSISGTTLPDIVFCYTLLEPYVYAIELNISCPNVKGFEYLINVDTLEVLLETFNKIGYKKPVYVKVPRYFNIKERVKVHKLIKLISDKGYGITIGNTKPVKNSYLSTGYGGESGIWLYENTLMMLEDTRSVFGDELWINACGGIDKNNYNEPLRKGANSVQYLTSYIYDNFAKNVGGSNNAEVKGAD